MAVTLSIAVIDIASVLVVYDRIKVYRATTSTGTFVEITTVGTRIPLVSGQTVYGYIDVLGASTNFYKVSYFNSVTLLESPLSLAMQGDGDPSLDILSVAELKQNFLFGLELVDEFGNPMPDSFFEFYIKAAVEGLEKELDLSISPKTHLNERHDFHKKDYDMYNYLQLLNRPVSSIESARLILPTDQQVINYDLSWLHPIYETGQINIIPGTGDGVAVALGLSSMWLPLLQAQTSFVPLVFYFDYSSGFPAGQVPGDIKELVGLLAAIGPLTILGDILFGPGLAGNSVNLDALGTNVKTTKDSGNSAFAGRLKQYRLMAKERIAMLRRYYHGVGLTAV